MSDFPIKSSDPRIQGSSECALPPLATDIRRLDLIITDSGPAGFNRAIPSSPTACAVEGVSTQGSRSPVHMRFDSIDDALQTCLASNQVRFDVIHSHYTLATSLDPVACLSAMRNGCRLGGLVAVREIDLSGIMFHPHLEDSSRVPKAVRHQMALHIARHPYAAGKLSAWAAEAGFSEVRTTAAILAVAERAELRRLASRWIAALEEVPLEQTTGADERMVWERWFSVEGAFALLPVAEALCWT